MIGTMVGGQVLSEEPDYDKMRVTARELGVDEEGFIAAARSFAATFPRWASALSP